MLRVWTLADNRQGRWVRFRGFRQSGEPWPERVPVRPEAGVVRLRLAQRPWTSREGLHRRQLSEPLAPGGSRAATLRDSVLQTCNAALIIRCCPAKQRIYAGQAQTLVQ